MKRYRFTNPWTGETETVYIEITEYRNPKGRVALQMYDNEGPYATLSVNLPKEKCDDGEFFVDVNNCPWAPEFLEKKKIAKPTFDMAFSGFCCYPKYKLRKEMMK